MTVLNSVHTSTFWCISLFVPIMTQWTVLSVFLRIQLVFSFWHTASMMSQVQISVCKLAILTWKFYVVLLCLCRTRTTLIPCFVQVHISWFFKSLGLPQELQYISQTLQWTEASKLLNNSNRSLSHTAWCSKSWRKKISNPHHYVSAKERKTLKKTKHFFFWDGVIICRFLLFVGVRFHTKC